MLDSSIVVALVNAREPELTERYVSAAQSDYAVCSVIKAELIAGAQGSISPQKTLTRLNAFGQSIGSFIKLDSCIVEHSGAAATACPE